MKRFITNKGALTTLGILLLFLLWMLFSYAQGEGNLILPSPVSTFSRLFDLLIDPYFYYCVGASLLRTLIGFSISFALAFLFGGLAGEFKFVETLLKPTAIVLKSAPTAAFVFFFLFLLGSDNAPIAIVILLAFPILYESIIAGFHAVPIEVIKASQVDGARRIKRIFAIKLPLAYSHILLGIVTSFALSFKTEIMAEIITGSTGAGLGMQIRNYRFLEPSDLSPIFAITLVAITLILFLDLLSFFLEGKLFKTVKIPAKS